MSTGTWGSASFPSPAHGKLASYRSWNGGDGRYEIIDGYFRPKWNPYTNEHASQVVSSGYLQFLCVLPGGGTDTRQPVVSQCYRPSDASYWPDISSNDILKTQNRLLEKVKGHDFHLGVALGESKRTVKMVESNLGKLGRSILALKRGDLSTAARQLGASPRTSRLKSGDVSGRWLEMQYGWLPLLNDTYQAAKAFEAISKGPRSTVFYQSRRATKVAYYTTGDYQLTRLHERKIAYSFELSEEVDPLRQLGLKDPASVLWELLPYSFVVDWFVPIGTYLDNLNQIPKLKGRWLVHSGYKTSGKVDFKWNASEYPPCGYHGGAHRYHQMTIVPDVRGEYSWTNRQVLSGPPPVPAPKVKLGGAVHGTRVWNAIALASQRFLR